MASMNMSEESKRCILRVNRRHCPHCDGYISLKTYKAHRRRYYDSESDTWHKIQFPDDLDDGLDDVDSPPMSESDNYCLRFSDQEEESKYEALAACGYFNLILHFSQVMTGLA